jgi:hypothetical protein
MCLSDARSEMLAVFDARLEQLQTDFADLKLLAQLKQERELFEMEDAHPQSKVMQSEAKKFDLKVNQAESTFSEAVQGLLITYRNKGDIEALDYILASIGLGYGTSITSTPNLKMAGTRWKYLLPDRRVINEFRFNPDGSVTAERYFDNAKWKRLDEFSVLLSFGQMNTHTIFHPHSGSEMRGYSSTAGTPRYLRRIVAAEQ